MDEKRKAGNYVIIHEIHVGEKEVVVGELPYDSPEKYMCAYYTANGIMAQYGDCLASDSYAEIMMIFADRIKEQAEAAFNSLKEADVPDEDKKSVDILRFSLIDYDDNIENKVVVIKPDVLRREYRNAMHQLQLCVGGFGAQAHSRGSACYCTNLFTGKSSRYERRDILGVMEVDNLPEWAKTNLPGIQKNRYEKEKETR